MLWGSTFADSAGVPRLRHSSVMIVCKKIKSGISGSYYICTLVFLAQSIAFEVYE